MCRSAKVSSAAKSDEGAFADAKPLFESLERKALEDGDNKWCISLKRWTYRQAVTPGPIIAQAEQVAI